MKGQDFFSDLGNIISGASGSMIGIKDDMKKYISNKINEILREFNFVTRDEFEVYKESLIKLKEENAKLQSQIEKLMKN